MRRINRLLEWCITFGNDYVLAGILFVLFFVRAYFSIDPDFGWHLSSGQYILQHGVPYHDIYTYTASDFPWIHHEWLADVFHALVYQVSGYFGLALLHGLLWTSAFMLLTRLTASRLRFITFIAVLAVLPFTGVRALTWSVFLSAVLIVLVAKSYHTRVRVLIPVFMLLWANMHGSFVLGLAYLVWQFIRYDRSPEWLRVVVLSLIATFITPYGPGMYVEVFRTMLDISLTSHITEWQPFSVGIEVVLFAGVWVASLILAKKDFMSRYVRFDTLLFLASFMSSRHLPLFVIYALAGTLRRYRSIIDRLQIVRALPKFVTVSIVTAILCVIGYSAFSTAQIVSVNPTDSWPEAIARDLIANPCEGNVFNAYNIGGYLIWKVPGIRVYIDGRMPSWQLNGEKYMETYLAIPKDDQVRHTQFKKYNIRCVVWSSKGDFTRKLQKEGWTVVLSDKGYSLLKKR